MLFDERFNLFPSEYPICEEFCDAINQSYWVHTEWDFLTDQQHYNSDLDEAEQLMARRCMLAISQIEVGIKNMWMYLPKSLPKPEISMVCATFADSEVRHLRAYSHLLQIMGFQGDFNNLDSIPCVKGRDAYLRKYKEFLVESPKPEQRRDFLKAVVLFSMFVENVSLFSQFFMLASFKKYKNKLPDLAKVVSATAAEEGLHGQFGMYIVNILKEEYPELWDGNMERSITSFAEKAYEAECCMIDWILEKPTFIKKGLVKDFLKHRFNLSFKGIGMKPIFTVRNKSEFQWYEDTISTSIHTDFFTGRPNTYSLKSKPINAEDLF